MALLIAAAVATGAVSGHGSSGHTVASSADPNNPGVQPRPAPGIQFV